MPDNLPIDSYQLVINISHKISTSIVGDFLLMTNSMEVFSNNSSDLLNKNVMNG